MFFICRMRTPWAISISIWSSSTTLVTLPTVPPDVMTLSPRRRFFTISWCCFTRFCCGRIISTYMMTKMIAIIQIGELGENRSPPNGEEVCA